MRLEADSTSASGICRRRGCWTMRHLHKKKCGCKMKLQQRILRNAWIEISSGFVTKMGMLFAGAWAGVAVVVVSGTGVIIGEDQIEGQSLKFSVVFLVTVGVELLRCACIVCRSHLPIEGNVTREPEVAKQQSCMNPSSMRADDIDHVKERTWILPLYSGRSAVAADVEHAKLLWEVGTVLAVHGHHE